MQRPKEYNQKTIEKRKKFFFNVLKKSLQSFDEVKKL
jgi:hypothetical protein